MKNILLILSTSRTSQDAIEYAVGLAKKEKAKLVSLIGSMRAKSAADEDIRESLKPLYRKTKQKNPQATDRQK